MHLQYARFSSVQEITLTSIPACPKLCGVTLAFFVILGLFVTLSHLKDADAIFAMICVDWKGPLKSSRRNTQLELIKYMMTKHPHWQATMPCPCMNKVPYPL
mmetsp:Transcript_1836/g.6843  ORF Transcript_1836/g.6843 Transcript_1836/m.6843 type:complete len:102 (+) Transcript_1836:598-903(+)